MREILNLYKISFASVSLSNIELQSRFGSVFKKRYIWFEYDDKS